MTILKWTSVIIETQPDAFLVECGSCGGSGGSMSTCSVCKGVGALVKCFPRVVCSSCGGGGGSMSTCSTCKGAGSVWVGNLKQY